MSAIKWLPFGCGVVLFSRALLALSRQDDPFWPPQTRNGKPSKGFIIPFRGLVWGLVAVSLAELTTRAPNSFELRLWAGIALFVFGFATAFAVTRKLGWKAAFGNGQGLQVDGIFQFSRNPIYVSTWIGIVGWALILPEPAILAALASWAALYFVAIPLEERALAAVHGEAFARYRKATHRFIGRPKSAVEVP